MVDEDSGRIEEGEMAGQGEGGMDGDAGCGDCMKRAAGRQAAPREGLENGSRSAPAHFGQPPGG